MPLAAKEARRPAGWLHERIREALAEENAPISAHSLALRLDDRFPRVYASAVFRALNRLFALGQVDRIETSASYLLPRRPAVIALLCRRCGGYGEVGDPATFSALERHARDFGFQPSRAVVEVKGFCPSCRAIGQEFTSRSGIRGASTAMEPPPPP